MYKGDVKNGMCIFGNFLAISLIIAMCVHACMCMCYVVLSTGLDFHTEGKTCKYVNGDWHYYF